MGTFIIIMTLWGVPNELMFVFSIAAIILFFVSALMIGFVWYRTGFAAEQRSYSDGFSKVLCGIMENTKKR